MDPDTDPAPGFLMIQKFKKKIPWGSGSRDPIESGSNPYPDLPLRSVHGITDPDPDPEPDPAFVLSGFQDANKK